MGTLRSFLIFFCISLSGNFIANAKDGYLEILNPRGEVNGSLFDMEMSVSSGVLNSGHENKAKATFRLHIVPYTPDKVYISLCVVNTSVRNGKLEEPSVEYLLNVSKEKPVDFLLSLDGKIIVRRNEPQKNWRIFKIIGNFLLFDYSKFISHKDDLKTVFSVDIPTIYGSCKTQNVKAATESGASVEQFFDPTTCKNFHSMLLSDVEDVQKIHGFNINNYRKYDLIGKNDTFFLDSLLTDQKVFWSPSDGKSLTHFLQTSYKFMYVHEARLSLDDTDFDFNNKQNLELSISSGDDFEEERSIVHLESMENFSPGVLIKEVRGVLEQIVNIWKTHQERDQAVAKELTKISALLEFFTFDQLVQLWEILKNDNDTKLLNSYYQIVPYAGTQASVLFARMLIIEEGISVELGDRMLTKLAGSIRKPTMKVLEALKEIAEAETRTHASLLAYSSALGIAHKDYPDSKKVKDMVMETNSIFFNLISKSRNTRNNFLDFRVAIQALGNLRSVSLMDNNLRVESLSDDEMIYTIQAFEKTSPTGYVFDLMIKILTDAYKNPELKAVALKIALKRLPSPQHFEVLARIMDSEPNYELYNLFESSVRALVKVNELPESSILWLRHREPMSRSKAFAFESPRNFPMGFSVRGYLFFNDLTWLLQQIYFDIYQNYNGQQVKMYTVFIRLFNVQTLAFRLDDKSNDDTLMYELTLCKGDKVVLSKLNTFDFRTMIFHVMKIIGELTVPRFNYDLEDIVQHLSLDYYFPTDAGKNAHIYFNIPWMIASKFNSLEVAEKSMSMNILSSLNFTAQSVSGLYLYHPHLKALQGSRELSSINFSKQIAFKIYQDTKARDFKNFIFELTDDFTTQSVLRFKKDTIVHLNQIGNEPFTTDLDDNFRDHVSVKIPSNNINSQQIVLKNDFFKYHAELYDYSTSLANKEFPESFSEMLLMRPYSDIYKISVGDLIVSFWSYINWKFLAHSAYSYGSEAITKPYMNPPVKKFSVQLYPKRIAIEVLDAEDKVKVSYSLSDVGQYYKILRIGPGSETSGLCFGSSVSETEESVYHIFYGSNLEDPTECPYDQFSFVRERKSQLSAEQIRNEVVYAQCIQQSPYLQTKDPTNNQRCAEAATSLRDMTIKMNYKNVPANVMKYLKLYWEWFVKVNNGISSENRLNMEGPGDVTIKTVYPMTSPHLNLDVLFPGEKVSFKLMSEFLTTDSYAVSDHYHLIGHFVSAPFCIVVASDKQLESSRHYLHDDTDSWVQYAQVDLDSVFVKRVYDDQLALKINNEDQEIIAYPRINSTTDKYEITLGENVINHIRTTRVLDTVFLSSNNKKKDPSFVVGYNGRSVLIVGSNSGSSNKGKCFRNPID